MTRRAAVVAWLAIAALPGCIDRDRVNTNCEWMGDTRFPIDSRNAGHQDHLVRDAQLAEELATRYADAEHERRFGYGGHGGLVDNGRVHHDCLARLVAAIQTNHGVTSEQVRLLRRGELDLGIYPLAGEQPGLEQESLFAGEPLALYVARGRWQRGAQPVPAYRSAPALRRAA